MPEDKTIQELGLDEYKYGFRDPEEYFFKTPRKGIDPEIVAMISKHKNEPEWMLEFRLNALESFLREADPAPGAATSPRWTSTTSTTTSGRWRTRAATWDDVPDDIKNTFEKLGIPQAEREILAGVGAQYESEVVYHSLKEELEEQGVVFMDMDGGLREHEDIVEEYFGTIIPPDDNKFAALNSRGLVRRLVRVRPAWGPRGHPASGVLPHQRGEHGPVRADAHHRRRGLLRPLHRGLHGPDVHHELAALGGCRAHRQAGGAHPVLHHPELVAQHLQPGDQAGRGLRERHHRVGGRQPGLQAHHEVPCCLPDGRGRAR